MEAKQEERYNNIAVIATTEQKQQMGTDALDAELVTNKNNNANELPIPEELPHSIEIKSPSSDDVASGGGGGCSRIYSFAYYDALKDLCMNNADHYRTDDTDNGQRIYGAVYGICDHLITAKQLVMKFISIVHEYDFDENTPGNGYRSFIEIVNHCINHTIKINSYVMQNRNSMLFRKSHYMKELESCNQYLASLCSCLEYLLKVQENSDRGSLFPNGVHTANDLFATAESINQFSFYGRCIALQFHDSMKPILKFLTVLMAGFAESYYRSGGKISKVTSSMWTSGQYYLNPEMRAKRIVNISHYAGVDFCKAFWSISENEFLSNLPHMVGPSLKINRILTIPPEPLQLRYVNATTSKPDDGKADNDNDLKWIDIPIPQSHLGTAPIMARFLSNSRRAGMMGERKHSILNNALPLSKGFIFHCHGGGFIATSSRSHEIYLRQWAIELNLPILSIDYSLAPEAPYPRALEEVFYAYCWSIKNCSLLGSTGERIVLAGDSAGAALNLAITIKSIEMHVRKPDGLFLIYSPVRMSFSPTPARLLCLLDPVVPFGFLIRCMKAYVNPSEEIINENKRKLAEKEAILNANNIGSKSQIKSKKIKNTNGSSSNSVGNNNNNSSISTTSNSILTKNGNAGDGDGGGSSSNKSTINEISSFVNLLNNKQTNMNVNGNSQSIDEQSIKNNNNNNTVTINAAGNSGSSWERIDGNINPQTNTQMDTDNNSSILDNNHLLLSPMSDRTSDTFASASLQSSQTIGNTDMITPDESNVGTSLEEDSQPITIHKPFGVCDLTYEVDSIDLNKINENDCYGTQAQGGEAAAAAAQAFEFDDNYDFTLDIQSINKNNDKIVEGVVDAAAANEDDNDDDDDDVAIKNDFVIVNRTNDRALSPNSYVTEFMEKYVLETTIDSNGIEQPILRSVPRTQSEENILIDTSRETITVGNLQNKLYKVAGDVATSVQATITNLTTPTPITPKSKEYINGRIRLNRSSITTNGHTINGNNVDDGDDDDDHNNDGLSPHSNCSDDDNYKVKHPAADFQFEVPNDPYLSPYNASDEIFKQMPTIKILTTNMDPCLDDCIMLAKKLKSFNRDITLDILERLPHGFLNFITLSKEANDGNKLCIKRLAELFDLKQIIPKK